MHLLLYILIFITTANSRKVEWNEEEKSLAERVKNLEKLLTLILGEELDTRTDIHQIKRREANASNAPEARIEDVIRRLPVEALKGLLRGTPGRDGRDGKDGQPGMVGQPGRDGLTGNAGRDGLPGKDGLSGKDGSGGPHGLQGLPGPQGSRGDPGTSVAAKGSIYTRWGRTTCSSNTSLIYKGFAGSSHYSHIGGGVNFQCMPLNPEFSRTYIGNGGRGAWNGDYMYGVEYHSGQYRIFPDSANNQNVPCARCYTNGRSAVMMVPARRTCPTDWSKEYEGYLMTALSSQKHPSTFECVDANPEYIAGLGFDSDESLFYFVRAGCGYGGHCPPYSGVKEITCVVCSK